MSGRSTMHIGKAIISHIEDDYERYIYSEELTESQAVSKLCKEWSMSVMEINDILQNYKKKQNDIDYTNDLGDII